LTYHDANKFAFTQYLGSDGTCTAPGPEPTPAPAEEASCLNDSTDGASITVQYDPTAELIYMFASNVPDSSYVAWGWGKSMSNVEMVFFSANGDSS